VNKRQLHVSVLASATERPVLNCVMATNERAYLP